MHFPRNIPSDVVFDALNLNNRKSTHDSSMRVPSLAMGTGRNLHLNMLEFESLYVGQKNRIARPLRREYGISCKKASVG
ncbi:hypothetical protein F5Y00DRAFT_238232 [Daldinia vernicosa]|uniref:uncharacterized protein n=1 Tax=Daldinia vernicosa TaxID=114800 RepID=UPI0020076333|nr:uncharacterized protein F5Y00DRAFT_238232 [Daldinia vernicosa]KAI0848372.1 hypothetical protein F5Y00DRAFT_238232 [Daldinia vernicosa]